MRVASAIVLVFAALPAIGQAINIDVGRRDASNLLPSSSYGGAASQPGVWNGMNLDASLVDVAGNPVGALFGGSSIDFYGASLPGASLDEQALLGDAVGGVGLSGDERSSVAVLGLIPGKYQMYVYGYGNHLGANAGGHFRIWESNVGYINETKLLWTPDWPGGQVEGRTYFKFDFTIADPNQYIQVILVGQGGDSTPSSTYCNGLQIVPVPSVGSVSVMGMAGVMRMRRRR